MANNIDMIFIEYLAKGPKIVDNLGKEKLSQQEKINTHLARLALSMADEIRRQFSLIMILKNQLEVKGLWASNKETGKHTESSKDSKSSRSDSKRTKSSQTRVEPQLRRSQKARSSGEGTTKNSTAAQKTSSITSSQKHKKSK